MTTPAAYNPDIRLAEILSDSRALLGQPLAAAPDRTDLWSRVGALEAMLKMLADAAEDAASC